MNMQQFTGWVTRLLNALPWRRAQRPPKPQMRARVTSPSPANRLLSPDEDALRRQKAETNPLCSTLPEDQSTTPEPPTTSQPLLLPAPEAASAPLLALPPPSTAGAADTLPPEVSGGTIQADPESRLAFARYLFKRGVFNEGFTGDSAPAQYRDRSPQG